MNKKSQIVFWFLWGGVMVIIAAVMLSAFSPVIDSLIPGLDPTYEYYGLMVGIIYFLLPFIFLVVVYLWIKRLLGK